MYSSFFNCQVKMRKELSGGYNLDTVFKESKGYKNELLILRARTKVFTNWLSDKKRLPAPIAFIMLSAYIFSESSFLMNSFLSAALIRCACTFEKTRQAINK